MTHIIGRGRYARQVYPVRAPNLSVVQVNYDQVVEAVSILPSAGAFFPRNIAGDPLRVTLPGVRPGNILEVDFRACLEKDSVYYATQTALRAFTLVTFDGVPPVLAPSATVFAMSDSSTGHTDIDVTVLAEPQPIFNLTSLAAAVIPAGATSAIVQIVYVSSAGVEVSSDYEEAPFATLRCSELSSVAAQPGPGTLIATGP